MKKTYVLDTNIPLLDPYCLNNFEDNDIVIPSVVIKELNDKKRRIDEVGKNARVFTKILDSLSLKGNIYDGVPLDNGGTFKVQTVFGLDEILNDIKKHFQELINDDYILAVAISLHRKSQTGNDQPVILVSRDLGLRVKCDLFKVTAQHYMKEEVQNVDALYQGWRFLPVKADILADYFSQNFHLHKSDRVFKCAELNLKKQEFLPNEYVILVDEDGWNPQQTEEELESVFTNLKMAILKYDTQQNSLVGLNIYPDNLRSYNIYPRNVHQIMLLDSLFDRRTPQKSIIGLAGSGKTLFALLASLIMTNDFGWYDEIILTRPPIQMEYDLGFLPGNESEKMDPYLRGFKGNLKYIMKQKNKDKTERKKSLASSLNSPEEFDYSKFNIRIESMSYMRGQTTNRQILIIDESQNTTRNAMKTALTRIGEDAIVIVMGDISQIDFHLLDATNNGLTHAVELMKNERISSHVSLVCGERSELSELIAQKWDKEVFQ